MYKSFLLKHFTTMRLVALEPRLGSREVLLDISLLGAAEISLNGPFS